jgi:hypothetical protein
MNSYLFLVTVLCDNKKDFNTFERYVSADTREEAFAWLATYMVNAGMALRGIEAIDAKTGDIVKL